MTVDRARMEKETAFATSAAPTPVPCPLAAWRLPAACSRLPRATLRCPQRARARARSGRFAQPAPARRQPA
jgi:hypothetical protein